MNGLDLETEIYARGNAGSKAGVTLIHNIYTVTRATRNPFHKNSSIRSVVCMCVCVCGEGVDGGMSRISV